MPDEPNICQVAREALVYAKTPGTRVSSEVCEQLSQAVLDLSAALEAVIVMNVETAKVARAALDGRKGC